MLGHRWRWLLPLAKRYVAAFGQEVRPRHRDVIKFLRQDAGFERARLKQSSTLVVKNWFTEPQKMRPVPAAVPWKIPAIHSAGALGDWLHLDQGDLEWFADLKGLGYKKSNPRLRHYHYRLLAKRSGSIRLIEVPKQRLKDLQRQILLQILNHIPAHEAAHGFVRGRSIKTFAAPHAGRRVVLRMDLQDFFPSFPAARIQAFFRTAGYPESVADLLAGICINEAPRNIWSALVPDLKAPSLAAVRDFYARPHLPQGAPTSPALANICAYRIDCRLSGLASSAGAVYTRYADDLAFSGDERFERCVERFAIQASAVLIEEGFTVNHRKTRIMRQGVRQHLAGLSANQHVNIVRSDFERLKATLTNCVRHGPKSQNRDGHASYRSHLQGRVTFVEMINPIRGERLRRIFNQIEW